VNRALTRLLLTAALSVLTVASLSAQRGVLTGAASISRVYNAIFDARFEQVPALLTQACPPADPEVCTLLDVVSLWWQIQIDPDNKSRDRRFQTRADAAVAAIEAWTKREPGNAEAWFYLGGVYGARAQWRVLRGETLSAARDGKRIKEALERSLMLDPDLQDAYFGIGLYRYYADVAPATAKILRFLLALPGGDKVAGMRQMLRARDSGQVLRDEADYQLHLIDLWYEKQPQHALALLRGLRERHPQNPHFLEQIARIEDVYLHDRAASLRSWRALLNAATARRVALAEMAETSARLALAPELDTIDETDIAAAWMRQIIAANPAAPAGAVLRARQQLRRYEERLDAPTDTARAYKLSLSGWRAYEHGLSAVGVAKADALADASRLLHQSIALRPKEMVARYRLARVLDAQDDDDAAVEMFESVLLSFETTPPAVYASACVDAARLYEQRGEIARAIELYRRALPIFGADPQAKDAAQRALARLAR
jgi:tetratricopeptide (TPR) repeat protein